MDQDEYKTHLSKYGMVLCVGYEPSVQFIKNVLFLASVGQSSTFQEAEPSGIEVIVGT